MGNSAYLVIEIENNGSVCAGAKQKGRLLLDVRKAVSADYIMFRFYGHERTSVGYTVQIPYYETVTVMNNGQYETRQEQRYRTEHRTAHGSANLFSSEVILHRFTGGSVAQGRYAFPFEVDIPPGLPGSQSYISGSNSCSISYHCQAKLHRPGMLTWNVKNSCEVLLNDEPYISYTTPMFLGPITTKVKFMKIIPRGTMTFGGRVSSSNVCANENLRLDYGISNDSTSRIKALEIEITCHISFSAEGHNFDSSNKIFSRRIDAALLACAECLQKKGDNEVDYGALLRQINEAKFGIDIPISNGIRSTYSGKLSSVRYNLSMTVHTTFGTKNKTIRIPIIMHRSGSTFTGEVPGLDEPYAVPVDWSAEEAPTAVLIMSAPPVELIEGYDSVRSLTLMLKESNQWQEILVLKEWLTHSPHNINLLTPDVIAPLFQCIKGDYSFYTFCQTIGEAMNAPHSTNKCTCRHIAEAAKAVPSDSKVPICNSFAPFCTDKLNARASFQVIGLTDMEMLGVLVSYC